MYSISVDDVTYPNGIPGQPAIGEFITFKYNHVCEQPTIINDKEVISRECFPYDGSPVSFNSYAAFNHAWLAYCWRCGKSVPTASEHIGLCLKCIKELRTW